MFTDKAYNALLFVTPPPLFLQVFNTVLFILLYLLYAIFPTRSIHPVFHALTSTLLSRNLRRIRKGRMQSRYNSYC